MTARARVRAASLFALGLCAPRLAAAAAAGDGGAGELVWLAINLCILIAVAIHFARRPISAHAETRRRRIEAELTGAREELAAAERRLAECQQSIVELDAEIEAVREAVRAQGEAERARIIEEARITAQRSAEAADLFIARELRIARSQLRRELAERTVDLAAELVERRVDEGDRERLLGEFLDRVEAFGSPAGGRAPAPGAS